MLGSSARFARSSRNAASHPLRTTKRLIAALSYFSER
jgi:hypothetical protein